jgi:hypothetical protein
MVTVFLGMQWIFRLELWHVRRFIVLLKSELMEMLEIE